MQSATRASCPPTHTPTPAAAAAAQVADVCAEALVCDAAAGKVVEVIAEGTAPARPLGELFASI